MATDGQARWETYEHQLDELVEHPDGWGAWRCACGEHGGGYRWMWRATGVKVAMANEWGEHVRDAEAVSGNDRPHVP
jgi:hypothetical protein